MGEIWLNWALEETAKISYVKWLAGSYNGGYAIRIGETEMPICIPDTESAEKFIRALNYLKKNCKKDPFGK